MLRRFVHEGGAAWLLALTVAAPLSAQNPTSVEARVKVLFQAFDLNESGWLSGRELAACNCQAYDANHNGEITWEEFRTGFARAPLFDLGGKAGDDDGARQATPPVTTAVAPGQRGAKADAAAAAAAKPAGKTAYQVGQTVEVNVKGTWYPATIVDIRDGRYALSRHDQAFGVTTSTEWISADQLRPFTPKPRVATPSATALPAAVPNGSYDCMTYGLATSVGRMRISGGMSSGVTPDGSGPQHRFTYDATSGSMRWPEGLSIVGFTVEQAEYRTETNGTPVINLHYRRQAGGNLNSMSCTRR